MQLIREGATLIRRKEGTWDDFNTYVINRVLDYTGFMDTFDRLEYWVQAADASPFRRDDAIVLPTLNPLYRGKGPTASASRFAQDGQISCLISD